MSITYHVGDSRAVIAEIPDGSVDLIASSPPFLALRSYLPAGHEAKGLEIGSESNPAMFLDTLLALTAEWGRVLAPHGSLAIELGDTYSGSGGGGGDLLPGGLRAGQVGDEAAAREHNAANWRQKNQRRDKQQDIALGILPERQPGGSGWPLAKSLALIPQLYAVALAYGINPLTGQPSPAGRWRVRNVIVWHRPNPAVGALGDKVRPSTSYIVVATRSAKRWFDLTAVRTEPKDYGPRYSAVDYAVPGRSPQMTSVVDESGLRIQSNPAGAPPLDAWFDEWDGTHDTWTLTTQPSSLAHYAMWPAKLAERLILMMCPREVCRVCGEPRRRMEGKAEYLPSASYRGGSLKAESERLAEGVNQWNGTNGATASVNRVAPTLGWTDCGHDDYRPGIVLDPFAGTGTTLAVADLHDRDAIGIDIDERNRDIYPARYDEVKRALYGTPPPMPGQGDLFAEVAG